MEIYEVGFDKWPTSTYILNNKAFIHAILKDPETLEALQYVKDNSKEDDPIPSFNLASYKLILAKESKSSEKYDDVPRLLSDSFTNFIKNFKKYRNRSDILNLFSCSVLTFIAQSKQIGHKIDFNKLTIEEKEVFAAKELLLNLFCDIENFITESYIINQSLSSFLEGEKTINNGENIFIVLKKWSSYTPLIPRKEFLSRGGGHFFVWEGRGFVVDPGPNFLENFFENKFHLADIDCVICSHGHIDHTQDLERIITLLYERNENRSIKQKIRLVLSPGCASKYGSLLSASCDVIDSCLVLYPNKEIMINDWEISFEPILANHFEIFSRKDTALSFIVKLYRNQEICHKIGFTNDTGFIDNDSRVQSFFKTEVDLLVANLGSDSFARLNKLAGATFPKDWLKEIKEDREIYSLYKDKNIINTLGYKNFKHLERFCFNNEMSKDYDWYATHLGFRGLLRLALNASFKYMIVTEFGEELKNFRHLFARSINNVLGIKSRILTGDVGTKFRFINGDLNPYCDVKNEYYNNDIVEKVVKSQDFKVIHFNSDIYNDPFWSKELINKFGYLL